MLDTNEIATTRVLLVEDNPGDSHLIAELLDRGEGSSFHVETVGRLQHAIERLGVDSFDVVLADLSLPDCSGLKTYRELRAKAPRSAIIILSGNDDEALAITAVREGAQDYLVKGQPSDVLLKRSIRHGIERKRTENELEELRLQQLKTARLAALGDMAGGIAHEINTPLATIVFAAENVRNSIDQGTTDTGATREMMDLIETTSLRIAKIIQSLLKFAGHKGPTPLSRVKVSEVVADVLSLCSSTLAESGIQIDVDEPSFERLELECRDSDIVQVLLSLLHNARDALETRSEKWIRLHAHDLGSEIEIVVQDSGAGIDPELHAKIYEPFFTTKCVGKGTGLGLSLSKGIVTSHGGSIMLDGNEPHTTFRVRLPRRQSSGVANAPRER